MTLTVVVVYGMITMDLSSTFILLSVLKPMLYGMAQIQIHTDTPLFYI